MSHFSLLQNKYSSSSLLFFADSRRAIIIVDILIKFNRINTNKIKIQMNSMQMNRVLGEFVIREQGGKKLDGVVFVLCLLRKCAEKNFGKKTLSME